MKLSIRLLFAVCLCTVLILFPFEQSEAQSADMLASELSCASLYHLDWHQMDERQRNYASRCDAEAADAQWHEMYGGMDETDALSAVVWE